MKVLKKQNFVLVCKSSIRWDICLLGNLYKKKFEKILYGWNTSIEHSNANSYTRCEKYIFQPRNDNKLLGPEVLYLSTIDAFMYLGNNIKPDIAFSVKLLARYNSSSTKRRWNEMKYILPYFRGTSGMSLFYSNKSNFDLVGFAYYGYLSYLHKTISQTSYLFTCRETAIFLWPVKHVILISIL